MELVQQLKEDGIAKGLCRLWQMKLKPGLGIDSLADLYIRGIDFCIKNDYPTLDFIRENFKGKCEEYGIYVDDMVSEKNRKNVVLNGDCKALLEYNGIAVAHIFVRHDSQANIVTCDRSCVIIDAFDDARLTVAVGNESKAMINLYGNAVLDTLIGKAKVIKKNKNTY